VQGIKRPNAPDSDAPDVPLAATSTPAPGRPPESVKARKTQLAAEARTVLNQFVDELRSAQVVDLSGKNLMDDGVEFVVEGLAFNRTCKVVRLGSNAMGARASMQLAEVLKVWQPFATCKACQSSALSASLSKKSSQHYMSVHCFLALFGGDSVSILYFTSMKAC
jgi:hypothetical protein